MRYGNPDEPSVCLSCGEALYGRVDKKFCNATCKNNFHNMETRYFRRECRVHEEKLRCNHDILQSIILSGKSSALKETLREAGFDTAVISGVVINENRHMEFLCLDIRYRMTGKKIFNIRKVCPSPYPSSRP